MTAHHRQQVPAGLPRRLAAALYDLLLLIALWMVVSALFLPLAGGNAPMPGSALVHWHRLALVLATAGFFIAFWKSGGQTLGMRAWGIKLVRADGKAATWRDCTVRFLAALLSLLPLGAGFWWAAFDTNKRAWHDLLSGTRLRRVIRS